MKARNGMIKKVEFYFYHEKAIRLAVYEARLDHVPVGNSPGGIINRPVERQALRNIYPLKSVVLDGGYVATNPEAWLKVIDKTYELLDKSTAGIARRRYKGDRYEDICKRYRIDKNKYYAMIEQVRQTAVLCAVQAGLIKVY